MTWKRDTRPENVRTFGDFQIFSEVDKDRRTAHVIRFPDGEEMRVLPSDRIGGHRRSQILREAVESVAEVWHALVGDEGPLVETFDPVLYLQGALHGALLELEVLSPTAEVSIEEWLEHWFANDLAGRGPADFMAECLLGAMQDDGWAIVREDYIRDLEAE